MGANGSSPGLNSSQALHLLTSAQHADKLLSDIEDILAASESKSPFPKFKNQLSLEQARVVGDYLGRIRAQIVRVLESQGISPPSPSIDSVHALRVNLGFAKIAFEDCTPKRMRGYGDLPEAKVGELNGVVAEMLSIIDKLDAYLAQGLAHNLKERLERLGQDNHLPELKTLERIIKDHGLVEFRSTLSMIIERLESKTFEIAVFGRVNSGKSSLLNAIVQANVLPVGVNPVTAVPTRLMHGDAPRVTVWYANKTPEHLDLVSLAEFVTEDRNPANVKHVTRIAVELPSPRLAEGIVLVDTPGLGSLATAGAAETLVYLPRCDLGVVLIDAGSTLTQEDLSTIRALYEAGVKVSLLLSKSDLLNPEDRVRSVNYVSQQLEAQLRIDLSPYPVSTQPDHEALLEEWFQREILPLYERHQQFTEESLRRKIGALHEAVETALRMRLGRSGARPGSKEIDCDRIDARLRTAAGRLEEAQNLARDIGLETEEFGPRALTIIATRLVENWENGDAMSATKLVRDTVVQLAASLGGRLAGALGDVARELNDTLLSAGEDLELSGDGAEDLKESVKGLPVLDPGTWDLAIEPSFRLRISEGLETRRIEQRLRRQLGPAISKAFYNFGKVLEAWALRVIAELQFRFDQRADVFRAYLDQLKNGQQSSAAEEALISRDLEVLTTH